MKTNDLVLVRMMKKQMISQVSFNETNLLFYDDNVIIHDILVLLVKEKKEMKAYSRKS